MTNTDGTGQDFKDKAKAAAASAQEQLKAGAQDVADTATEEATNYANRAKGAAADEVKNVSSALRHAAEDLRSGSPQERTFSQIAESLADASDAIRDKDLGEVIGTVTNFARRNPLAFLGGAALLGFAATRFVKASSTTTASTTPGGQTYGAPRDLPATTATSPNPYTPSASPTGTMNRPVRTQGETL